MPIRLMTIEDINKVISLERDIFKETLGYDMLFREITTNMMAIYFVYEINGEIIGYIGSWNSDEVSEIINFLISKDYQKKGYGQKLLLHFLEEIKKRKIRSCFLDVKESNLVAIRLYEKYGFNFSRMRKNYYSDGSNAIVLVKDVI